MIQDFRMASELLAALLLMGLCKIHLLYHLSAQSSVRNIEALSHLPDEAVRLIPAVAQAENSISGCTFPESGSGASTPDSSEGRSSARSVRFNAKCDSDVLRLQYQWPEGSL